MIIVIFGEKVLKYLNKFVKINHVTERLYDGEYGEGVNTADCGSVMLGFESLYSPHFFCKRRAVVKLLFYVYFILKSS